MSRTIRCAIYTRKSTEEGLEQAFNSLDAQREACEAFVRSQVHEGWSLQRGRYDDGGYSGGTLDRPGLQKLLADVGAGKIDMIVVYKVDRLTRSLADFARIVDRLDAKKASFVSVTQSFNTATSMGRLTLNMLLSFAQFEREVTSERIRDKVAASKAKGMWMGGTPPLGYRSDGPQLVVVPEEAELVRRIFRRYLELRSIPHLVKELATDGACSKKYVAGAGRSGRSSPYSAGALQQILRNPVYIGDIRHKGLRHPGRHQPIVDRQQWDSVQASLNENRRRCTDPNRQNRAFTLRRRIFDRAGLPMTVVHTVKSSGLDYRYYVSPPRAEAAAPAIGPASRLSATKVEGLVERAVLERLPTPERAGWPLRSPQQKDRRIRQLVRRVQVTPDGLELVVDSRRIDPAAPKKRGRPPKGEPRPIQTIVIPAKLRSSSESDVIVPDHSSASDDRNFDRVLITALARARHWRRRVEAGRVGSIVTLAADEGLPMDHLTARLQLAYLAPDITQMILAGRQPHQLTLPALCSTRIPAKWDDQREMVATAFS